jgi:hypothetical protein
MAGRWKWVILGVLVIVVAGPKILRALQPQPTPWDELKPALPTATLSPDTGGPLEIGSMCLDVASRGPGLHRGEIREALTAALGLMGVEVLNVDCDASLTVNVSGDARSAQYAGVGACWSGYVLNGEVSLTIDNHRVKAWAHQVDEPSAPYVSGCNQDPALGWYLWQNELIGAPLKDMFGELGGLAAYFGFRQPYGPNEQATTRPSYGGPFTPVGVQAVAAWITADPAMLDDYDRLSGWLRAGGNALVGVTPYLVAHIDQDCQAAPEDCERWSAGAERLLKEIYSANTGLRSPKYWYQSQWWAWWESIAGDLPE